ncbi:YNFM family putative membrane transporter [Kushneria sinocarnis]|uniref:YNFM family putative membrane transporter n=1 Tax=Kushneria sinocarnis TaxID=595502 RepID=A0A420WUH2_9GAMM|nr:MFS transporter [Kushneria sinocarnis]RKQ97083.1 YNFM family putative membrane transporter [Kushneria sinocarnis]
MSIEPRTPRWWRATLALSLGSFLIFVNLYAIQPLMPRVGEDLNLSSLQASWLLSVATLTLAIALLIFGPLSDAIGRRALMLITMALATVCTLMLSLAPGYASLLALRALQGFLLGGLPAVAVAWMGDEFTRPALTMAVGLYISGNSLGGISGRVIGGAVGGVWGWRASFVVVGLLSVVAWLVFLWLLPHQRSFVPRSLNLRRMGGDLLGHLRNRMLLGAYLLGGLNFFVFVNLYSYITFRLSAPPFGLATQWLGLLFLTYLGGTVGSAFSGRLTGRLSQPAVMISGIVLLMAGTLITLSGSLPIIVAGLCFNAFGFFMCHSMASSWVGRQAIGARASASSLYLMFYYLGASLGGFYLEPFWKLAEWPGVVAAALAVFCITLTIAELLRRMERCQLVRG